MDHSSFSGIVKGCLEDEIVINLDKEKEVVQNYNLIIGI